MRHDWSDFGYIFLAAWGLGALCVLITILLDDVKQSRRAQGKSGWFDRPTITAYTGRKVIAAVIFFFGILIALMAIVAEESLLTCNSVAVLFVTIVFCSIGRAVWEVESEDERRGRPGWRALFLPERQPRRVGGWRPKGRGGEEESK